MINLDKFNLDSLKCRDNYRRLPKVNMNELIDLCSNDYLGLSRDKELLDEFEGKKDKNNWMMSASSSRLLSGNRTEHVELEKLIAEQYQRESCLLFNSGYHANVGIISAITSKNDLIITDKLVHASIIDGAKLSAASFKRFNHLDYEHLELLLDNCRNDFDNVFIISEGIFSMDGDLSDLQRLVELKQKFGCFLYIDEAHSVGVRGEHGIGCVEEYGVVKDVDFIVGTFGKALASVGAFVVCNKIFKDYLVNCARTFIYTTALPPINIAWSKFIFERLSQFSEKRKLLKQISIAFSEWLNVEYKSHIVPLILGENDLALEKSKLLETYGFKVLPIRHPTVPVNSARLRFSLSADMKLHELERIKKILIIDEQSLVE